MQQVDAKFAEELLRSELSDQITSCLEATRADAEASKALITGRLRDLRSDLERAAAEGAAVAAAAAGAANERAAGVETKVRACGGCAGAESRLQQPPPCATINKQCKTHPCKRSRLHTQLASFIASAESRLERPNRTCMSPLPTHTTANTHTHF